MDAAEPPRVVFQTPAPCDDAERAAQLLRRAMATARAPGKGWSVAMRVDRLGARSLEAEGDIADGDGMPIAHRVLAGASDCSGLARAVAVWASLVLDAQRSRAMEEDGAPASATSGGATSTPTGTSAPARGASAATPATASSSSSAPAAASTAPASTAATAPVVSGWPAPAEAPKPTPEHDWYLHHDDVRTFELGAAGFLMTGEGSAALAGVTGFAVIEAGGGLFLRPSVLFGKSTTALPPQNVQATMLGARVDACLRLPGLYTNRRGIQLDACGGAEGGGVSVNGTNGGVLGFGPSMDLRGELGGPFSAALRGIFDLNAIRPTPQDPWLAGRLELAFSWRLR